MKLKNAIALTMAAVLAAGLTACGGSARYRRRFHGGVHRRDG